MMGLGDFWVTSGFVLTILSTILCIVYGIKNWNKGGEEPPSRVNEERAWDEEEQELEKNL